MLLIFGLRLCFETIVYVLFFIIITQYLIFLYGDVGIKQTNNEIGASNLFKSSMCTVIHQNYVS